MLDERCRWWAGVSLSCLVLSVSACSDPMDGTDAPTGSDAPRIDAPSVDVGSGPDTPGVDGALPPDVPTPGDGGALDAPDIGALDAPDIGALDAPGTDAGTDAGSDAGPAVTGYDIDYATYFGGGDFDRVQALAVDSAGVITIAGSTQSPDLPTTPGAYDRTGPSGSGVASNAGYVARFAADGTLLWATFLDGSDRDDIYGIRLLAGGDVILAGWTASTDFPTTAGAYDRTHNGSNDIFVARLRSDGAALVWSTFIGGSDIDQCRGAMAIAASGDIYLAGYTESTNFPTTATAYQRTNRGGMGDALVAVVSSDGARLVASTMLGGTAADYAFSGLVLHADGTPSISGVAGGASFPTTAGAYQTTFGGVGGAMRWPGDAFVARFSADLSSLVFSTFLGGTANDASSAQNALALHPSGDLIVSGHTESTNFPTTSGALSRARSGPEDLFVSRLSADGATLVASSYVGGSMAGNYEPSGLVTAADGAIMMTGWTSVTDFPVTSDAVQPTHRGGTDTVITLWEPGLDALRYATFYGGTSAAAPGRSERIRVAVFGPGGALIVAGDTDSNDLVVTSDAYQAAPRGDGDGFLLRLTPR